MTTKFWHYSSYLLAAAILGACISPNPVCAQTVGVHLGSMHSNHNQDWNNVNPGLYLQYEGWTVGSYYNSERKQSVYAGYTWEGPITGPVNWGITVGAISGYDTTLVPMVIPSVSVNDPLFGGAWRLSFAAKVGANGAAALHLSHEWHL